MQFQQNRHRHSKSELRKLTDSNLSISAMLPYPPLCFRCLPSPPYLDANLHVHATRRKTPSHSKNSEYHFNFFPPQIFLYKNHSKFQHSRDKMRHCNEQIAIAQITQKFATIEWKWRRTEAERKHAKRRENGAWVGVSLAFGWRSVGVKERGRKPKQARGNLVSSIRTRTLNLYVRIIIHVLSVCICIHYVSSGTLGTNLITINSCGSWDGSFWWEVWHPNYFFWYIMK